MMKMKDLRVIIRRYRDGWSCKKIAQALDCSLSTVSNICHKKELLPYIGELKRRKYKQNWCKRIVADMLKPKPKKQKRKSRPKRKTLSSVISQITGVSMKADFRMTDVQEDKDELAITGEQRTDENVVRHTVSIPKQKKWVPSKTVPDDKIE